MQTEHLKDLSINKLFNAKLEPLNISAKHFLFEVILIPMNITL